MALPTGSPTLILAAMPSHRVECHLQDGGAIAVEADVQRGVGSGHTIGHDHGGHHCCLVCRGGSDELAGEVVLDLGRPEPQFGQHLVGALTDKNGI